MTEFVQELINGLFLGGIYALFAVGLTLSLGVLRVMNLAHGATLAIAAIAGIKLVEEIHLPFAVLILFGALVGGVVGVFLELVAFRPLRVGPTERNVEMPSIVSSLAVLFMLQTVAQVWTHSETLSVPPDVFHTRFLLVGPFFIRSILLVTFALAVGLVIVTWLVVNRTQFGRAVRAIAMDDEAAGMIGINGNRLKLVTISASGALAGIAGILIGVSFGAVDYTMGQPQLLRGFAVVILGGIGSVAGALVGGLLLGLSEGMTIYFFGSSWQEAAAFVLLLGFLMIRPQGVFGKPLVDRA